MYFHPLQEEINKVSEEDLSNRIRELTKKLTSARRFSRNPDTQMQLQKALQTYQTELKARTLKVMQDNIKKARGEPELGDLINID